MPQTPAMLVGFDFGSANIRAATVRAAPTPGAAPRPHMVEFNGRPALPNLALLSADKSELAAVGDGVLLHDEAAGQPHWGLAVENDSSGELGQAATLLLQHIIATLARDHGFAPDAADWAARVAVPSGAPPDLPERMAARLRGVGFADVAARDSALAALAAYGDGQPPGRYLVVDQGAARTRFALVESRADAPPRVLDAAQDSPGGRDFDRALFNHFAPALSHQAGEPVEFELPTRALLETFKIDFAHAWAAGRERHEGVYELGYTSVALALDRATFAAPDVAGPLLDRFRQVGDAFLAKHAADGAPAGIILVGGGAHWPFVAEWAAARAGRAGVLTDQYPEEAVARGLLRQTAREIEPVAPPTPAPPPARPIVPRPAPRPASPGLGFAVEFVGGLVGVLGLGWFFVRKQFGAGCAALVGWWAVLALLFALGIVSALGDRPAWLLPVALLWIGVPLASAWRLARVLRAAPAGREE